MYHGVDRPFSALSRQISFQDRRLIPAFAIATERTIDSAAAPHIAQDAK